MFNYLCFFLFFLTSCAHHKDVYPSKFGVHTISFSTPSKKEGHKSAMEQAIHFCERDGKKFYMVDEKIRPIKGESGKQEGRMQLGAAEKNNFPFTKLRSTTVSEQRFHKIYQLVMRFRCRV